MKSGTAGIFIFLFVFGVFAAYQHKKYGNNYAVWGWLSAAISLIGSLIFDYLFN